MTEPVGEDPARLMITYWIAVALPSCSRTTVRTAPGAETRNRSAAPVGQACGCGRAGRAGAAPGGQGRTGRSAVERKRT
ncbi:hypothetical protein GCM10010350_63170 [Streptomyces galilaeus]|nr:hypothetical protein GCM10010350_63170 [Streptomyces galilaeus]